MNNTVMSTPHDQKKGLECHINFIVTHTRKLCSFYVRHFSYYSGRGGLSQRISKLTQTQHQMCAFIKQSYQGMNAHEKILNNPQRKLIWAWFMVNLTSQRYHRTTNNKIASLPPSSPKKESKHMNKNVKHYLQRLFKLIS